MENQITELKSLLNKWNIQLGEGSFYGAFHRIRLLDYQN
jgi:hypothetical protein